MCEPSICNGNEWLRVVMQHVCFDSSSSYYHTISSTFYSVRISMQSCSFETVLVIFVVFFKQFHDSASRNFDLKFQLLPHNNSTCNNSMWSYNKTLIMSVIPDS